MAFSPMYGLLYTAVTKENARDTMRCVVDALRGKAREVFETPSHRDTISIHTQ
jgi:hypothetical protein